MKGFYDTHITKIRESFDDGHWERVFLLKVIIKASPLI